MDHLLKFIVMSYDNADEIMFAGCSYILYFRIKVKTLKTAEPKIIRGPVVQR